MTINFASNSSQIIAFFGLCFCLSGCGQSAPRNADGSTAPTTNFITGKVNPIEHLKSLPTVQRHRAVALALIRQYELSQFKTIERMEASEFKLGIWGIETGCVWIDYFDVVKKVKASEILLVTIGPPGGAAPIQVMDITRSLNIGGCGNDTHGPFAAYAEVRNALQSNRDPITLG